MNCLSAIPRVLLLLLIAPVLPATATGADTPAVGPTPQATMLPTTWRLNYPTVPVRWWTIRQASFNVDIDDLSRGFRLNIRLYPTNSSLNTPFPKGELSARLLEASGRAWTPTDDGLLDTPFSLEFGPPQTFCTFPWSSNGLDNAVLEVRLGDTRLALDLPAGFTLDPRIAFASSNVTIHDGQKVEFHGRLVAQSHPDPFRRVDRFIFGLIPAPSSVGWGTVVVLAGEDRYSLRVPRGVYAHDP